MKSAFPKYLTVEKAVGETPLQALERLRKDASLPASLPLAYAGRLDPMASGKLLILVGEECRVQERYHKLDKEYTFGVLLGVASDTSDVLGIVHEGKILHPDADAVTKVLKDLEGPITLSYPHFSAKTVRGKPLHTWALEGKLDTITIPTKTSTIYTCVLTSTRTIDTETLAREIFKKVNSIPPVTDVRKEQGKDFRRDDVRASWEKVFGTRPKVSYTILSLRCVASSGTYMRTLAHLIGERLGTKALAYSIHRTQIGRYLKLPHIGGFFYRTY